MKSYITDTEREKCRKIVDAFGEIYEECGIIVLDAEKYGFVKLQYFTMLGGFEDVASFTDGSSLFEALWKEWLALHLYDLVKGTPMADKDNEEIIEQLTGEQKEEILIKKKYFMEKADMASGDQ